MPIDHKNNILFIHIPKTGGSSIENYLGIKQSGDNFLKYGEPTFEHDGILYSPQHFTCSMLKQHLGDKYFDFFKFTFVRNPYSRIISEYKWRKKYNKTASDLNKFIESSLTPIKRDHLVPQANFADDSVDFVGKFENLNEDFNKVLSINKLTKGTLKKINVTDRSISVDHISRKNINLINSVYREDFHKFNYKML